MFAMLLYCCRGRALSNVVRTCCPTPSGPDPDFSVLGAQQGEGSRGSLCPLWVQGKAVVGGSGGVAPDGKRFSVFNNGFEGSPLHYFVKRSIAFNRFSIVRNIKKNIQSHVLFLKSVARKSAFGISDRPKHSPNC